MKPDGQHSKSSGSTEPLVSVIIPVFNREEYVKDAIASVIAQDYPHVEIIVVDDGSTDQTPEVLMKYGSGITVLTQKNRGPSAARNLGISHAKGSIIGLLDSDDRWPAGRISELLPHLSSNTPIVRGLTQYFKSKEGIDETVSDYHLVALNVGSCLYDATVFTHVGTFDEAMKHAEDLDWCMRAGELGYPELRVPVPALQHRRHDNNLTNTYAEVHKGKIRAFEKKVLRAQERNK